MARKVLRTFFRLSVFATVSVALLSILTGCGGRPIGYGVLLWSTDEEQMRSGTVVPVFDESDLNDSYSIGVGDSAQKADLARWRVEFFTTGEEAEAYAAEMSDYATMYARATRNALPMRSSRELDQENIVYRLREDETIKIVGRDEEQSNLSGLVSYWYQGLTEDGVRGYVFGYELSLFDPFDSSIGGAERGETDPLIDLLLTNVWRPVYFIDMINSGAYDLSLFKPEYGLFPNPDENVLELKTRTHATTFHYDDITRVGSRRYLAEGTSLQLTFRINDELSLQYLLDGNQYSLAMQRVSGEVEEYVEAELDRRKAVYEDLASRGPVFSSGNYGTIELYDEQKFLWTDFGRLVPNVIPATAPQTGAVDLGVYPSRELRDRYTGAIAFRFDGVSQPIAFLYTLSGDGMRMVFVPQSDIEDKIVQRVGINALTLFFASSGG